MIKIMSGVTVALVLALGYSVYRIDGLNKDLGAADSECTSRIAEFERDMQKELAEQEEAARQDQELVRKRFESRLQLVAQELEVRNSEVREMQEAFQRRLELADEPEARQWLDTPIPESLLQSQQP